MRTIEKLHEKKVIMPLTAKFSGWLQQSYLINLIGYSISMNKKPPLSGFIILLQVVSREVSADLRQRGWVKCVRIFVFHGRFIDRSSPVFPFQRKTRASRFIK